MQDTYKNTLTYTEYNMQFIYTYIHLYNINR